LSQYTWTYVGGAGKNYRVTLFHGKRTGHVMILLNRQVLQIDFHIRESKTYSFFIEDEFCEVRLERRGKEMYYSFEINKKVDTPRNKARKKTGRKHLGQALLFFSALILAATGLVLGFRAYYDDLDGKHAARDVYSDSVVGMVQLDTFYKGSVTYHYVVGNNAFSGVFFEDLARGDSLPLFPLESGDAFIVRYHSVRPDMSRIVFSQPTDIQVQKYFERSLARHLRYHPDLHPEQARCTLEVALELRGLYGLADVYFQRESTADSPIHNRDSYYRLVRDTEVQKALSDRCWD